ncbi:diguanylate cyclase [Desulfosporosinus sp. FKA]|uniref:diguanylate cyclase n=1 Tax=Desulfosporosinus sp. FKA TaxID=1969834 RepID=UPI001557A52C|nr:diguanylate cyclase [Desulfosporosinus sp. FKA]
MVIKLSDAVAQKIVELIHKQSGFDVIVCDNTGTIIADSEQVRIGQKHKGSYQILTSDKDSAVITAQEAEESNGRVKEGVSIAIEAEGAKIGTFGIAGPLEIVPPVARIAAGMIIMMLRDEELKDFIRNQVRVLGTSVDQAANGEFDIVFELLKNTTESITFENGNCPEIYKLIDKMSNLAFKDTLTGTYNRRYIDQKLPVDIISTSLSEQSLSIIIADIDFFKNVNDTHGHVAGDHTLKAVADILSGCIQRESDWISRYGGEEFLICLPGAGLKRAVEIAEHMRSSVENSEIVYGECSIKITASLGVCSIKPSSRAPRINAEKLIECADNKLYVAKHKGRNRVEA